MSVLYRNTRTGRVARLDGPVAHMDRSSRWVRIDEPEPEPEPAPEPEPEPEPEATVAPSSSEVRAWAREQGIEVPSRGRLPADVVAAYQERQ